MGSIGYMASFLLNGYTAHEGWGFPGGGASYLADPSVAGLVYVAAHMPDAGENEGDDGKRFWANDGQSGAIGARRSGQARTAAEP